MEGSAGDLGTVVAIDQWKLYAKTPAMAISVVKPL
jgi:hypothetical protein